MKCVLMSNAPGQMHWQSFSSPPAAPVVKSSFVLLKTIKTISLRWATVTVDLFATRKREIENGGYGGHDEKHLDFEEWIDGWCLIASLAMKCIVKMNGSTRSCRLYVSLYLFSLFKVDGWRADGGKIDRSSVGTISRIIIIDLSAYKSFESAK